MSMHLKEYENWISDRFDVCAVNVSRDGSNQFQIAIRPLPTNKSISTTFEMIKLKFEEEFDCKAVVMEMSW